MSWSLGLLLVGAQARARGEREALLLLSLVDLVTGTVIVCLAEAGTQEVMTERMAPRIDATALAVRSMPGPMLFAAAVVEAFRGASQIIALATSAARAVTKTAFRTDMISRMERTCR